MPDGKRGGLAKRQGLVDSRQRIPGRKRGDWQNTRGRGGARQKKGGCPAEGTMQKKGTLEKARGKMLWGPSWSHLRGWLHFNHRILQSTPTTQTDHSRQYYLRNFILSLLIVFFYK
jgi:hypothetical protein